MRQGRGGTLRKYPPHPLDYMENTIMDNTGSDYYGRILDGLGADGVDRYDREESGIYDSGTDEYDQGGGSFAFGALCRADQIAILRALDANLPTKTKRVNRDAGNSYGLKHTIERYTGFYVSNLQAKTAMRILGYRRGGDDLNPSYNISTRERRTFDELSREVAERRRAAHERIARRKNQRACAHYFARMAEQAAAR